MIEIKRSFRSLILAAALFSTAATVHAQAMPTGQLVNEASNAPASTFYSSTSRDLQNGDIILKAVNFSATPQTMQIALSGAQDIGKTAIAQVLTGLPTDTKSIENPRKIAPQNVTLNNVGPNFTHEFPAYSVTVVRFKARK